MRAIDYTKHFYNNYDTTEDMIEYEDYSDTNVLLLFTTLNLLCEYRNKCQSFTWNTTL